MNKHPDSWKDAKRILFVRLDAMGDVLMTEPAFRAVKTAFPEARLSLLTSPSGASVATMMPEIDEVLTYEAPWMKSARPSPDEDRVCMELLKSRNFDAAVIFTVYSQNPLPAALLCHWAGIPLRLAHCRENPYYLLTDWRSESEPESKVRHEVRRQLDLVASIGAEAIDLAMCIRVPRTAFERLDRKLPNLDRPILLHPGATAASRRYPAERYGEVARHLTNQGWSVLVTGGAEERVWINAVAQAGGEGCSPLAGLLDVEEFAALISRARLLVSNNTGAVHLASAVNTPVVDLYALTNPQHTPWGIPHRVLSHPVSCAYCYKSVCPQGHHLCLRGIPSSSVIEAIESLIRETSGEPHARDLSRDPYVSSAGAPPALLGFPG